MQTSIFIIFTSIVLGCHLLMLPVNGDSEDLLNKWKEIKANYSNNIEKYTKIFNQLKQEQQAIGELKTIVERHLRTKNAELLANAIGSNDVPESQKKIRDILEHMMNNYDKNLIESILSQAINEVIEMRKVSELPDILWRLYEKGHLQLFQIMLRAQIQLYSRFDGKYYMDGMEFFYKFAIRLFMIQREPMYNKVDLDLKSNVEHLISKLPENLKYLLFTPRFCLLNAQYEKYIYTAVEAKLDKLSRYIWLWRDTSTIDDTSFIRANITDYTVDNEINLKTTLMGTKYQMYYYMMADTNVVAGWDSNAGPLNHIWNVEFVGNDRVVFSQNDYLMCAIESYDNDRRNVGGRKKGAVSSKNSECQWYINVCDRKK